MFISYCFEQGYAPSTISTYVSGISFHHKVRGLHDPANSFIVRKLLEGCKRACGHDDIRAPITDSILQKLYSTLSNICFSSYECSLFRAAYLLAYFGLMRVSELAYTSALQPDRPLLYSDLQITRGSKALLISIRTSKTNQRGPPTTIRVPSSASDTLCAVKAMQDYLGKRPIGQEHKYLFCHANGAPLTRSQFSGVLAKAIQSIGLPVHIYTSHSFRIGRASVLAANGVPHEDIKKLGRWKSATYLRYIRNN